MKRQLLSVIFACATATTVYSQCTETDKTKILLAGDSWAFFMNTDGTLNNALTKWGHSDKNFYTNLTISENGSETVDFLGAVKQDEIAAQLLAHPDIEVVHLSIGGNDVLGDWNINFTQEQTDSLEAAVTVRLTAIIDFIKSVKPGIRIVWSGYVYPNFGEVLGILSPAAQSSHAFFDTWDGMGQPTFLQINEILNSFSASVEAYADNDPQVDFVKCTGVLQHVFGQTTPLAVAPGGTYVQFEAPMPIGYPEYPSPMNTMRDYFFFKDCFHLSAPGYSAFIDYQMQKFYHKFFMDDLYLLSNSGARTGGVSSTGVVTSSPMLGESGGMDFATVLSFNTSNMEDTTVAKASIFLRRESLVGGNPYSSGVEVKVISGNFGGTVNVEADDFSATGDASANVCIFGSNGDDGHWVRLELPENLLPFITNEEHVQFVISAPGVSGALVTFNDGTDPDFAPVLNITYTFDPSSVADIVESERILKVYPNPTNGQLTIDTEGQAIQSLEVVNILGSVVISANGQTAPQLDLSHLPAGPYMLHVTTEKGSTWQRVVKQ
jgi:hypothetical protein